MKLCPCHHHLLCVGVCYTEYILETNSLVHIVALFPLLLPALVINLVNTKEDHCEYIEYITMCVCGVCVCVCVCIKINCP